MERNGTERPERNGKILERVKRTGTELEGSGTARERNGKILELVKWNGEVSERVGNGTGRFLPVPRSLPLTYMGSILESVFCKKLA